jgi:hypothetical protein
VPEPPSRESRRRGLFSRTRVLGAPSQDRSTAARSPSRGTRTPARGPAAAQPPSPVPPSVAQLSLDLTFAEARERGKKEKKTERGDDRRL